MRDHDVEEQLNQIIRAFKEERIKQKLSHDDLAQRTGLSRPAISFIESGDRSPTMLTCLKIAKALNMDLGKTITGFGVTDPKA